MGANLIDTAAYELRYQYVEKDVKPNNFSQSVSQALTGPLVSTGYIRSLFNRG